MICLVYEAILLFGVFFVADLLFELFTQHVDATTLRFWRQLYLFLVIGIYFTHFWRHGGQTLPMKTWHIKIVSTDLNTPTLKQAWLRYVGAWMWIVPALVINFLFNVEPWLALTILAVGIVPWALASRLDVHGQFLHDKLAGTQLISVPSKKQVDDES